MLNNNNGYPSSLSAWTTVVILMVAYVLSFIDRQILNLLVEPMIRESHILQRQVKDLRRTRDLLLPRLLSGQIEVEVA